MAGFLGEQILLSNAAFGSKSIYQDTVGLASGQIINASSLGANGTIAVTSTDQATGVQSTIFTLDPVVLDGFKHSMDKASVTTLSDGGFVLAVNSYVSFSQTDLLLQRFDASGNTVGALKTINIGGEKTTGEVDLAQTTKGFFIGMKSWADGGQSLGRFYTKGGSLLAEVSFGDINQTPPVGTTLANGKFALTWRATDGVHTQVFNASGTAVSADQIIPGTTISGSQNEASKITALPGGGFATLYRNGTSLFVQQQKNDGSLKGNAIEVAPFDMLVSPGFSDASKYDLAITQDGNIAVVWVESGGIIPTANKTDVYFSLFSAKGNLIIGPQRVNKVLAEEQQDVHFSTLSDGRLLIGYHDDQFQSLSYTNASQGVFVENPDWFWEGNGNNNVKSGTNGDDVMLGLGGNDTLRAGKGSDYVKGGTGRDKLFGDAQGDELLGEDGKDKLFGGDGADTLYGGNGDDSLDGGKGKDQLFGEANADILSGGAGDDTAYGGLGDDTLNGDAGADWLFGGDGRDRLFGGRGDDNLYGDAGKDVLKGGAGFDKLYGGDKADRLYGGDGADNLLGEDGNDQLYGGGGDDFLRSGAGRDREYGGAGSDTLYDSLGNDKMYGGADADTFLFSGLGFGKDVIKDFEFGVDLLDMRLTANFLSGSGGLITTSETTNGVKFIVDADNWVLVEGATLTDFVDGDYLINFLV
jgi:Ca2+-binding RTX toxin-like protein